MKERRKLKRWMSLALATLTLCAALTGCGTSDSGKEPAEAPVQSESQVEPRKEPEAQAELGNGGETLEPSQDADPVPLAARGTEQVESSSEPTPDAPPTETTLPKGSTFSIRFIDVGQADAALVECDGHYALIDGGNKDDSSLIYSLLKTLSVPSLDLMVGTHAHEDHIGGLPGALNYTTADTTLSPVTSYDSKAFSDFAKYADSEGGGITVPRVGDTYELGSADIVVLAVNTDNADTNNTSIVLKITYGETSFLLTGDAERETEQAVLNSGADISATVLKVGHHGSDSSTTYPFLREVMPQYAVISVGTGNTYGHPTGNTLSRLRDADVTVYRTDLQGDIICTSDGKNVTFTTEKNANADTLSNPGTVPVVTPKPTPTPAPSPAPSEEPAQTTPVGTDYVLNTNTKKFHYPDCSSVKKMKEANKGFFTGTRDEVISMGYDPCGNCHP